MVLQGLESAEIILFILLLTFGLSYVLGTHNHYPDWMWVAVLAGFVAFVAILIVLLLFTKRKDPTIRQ